MISVHIGYCELSRDQALNIVAYLTVGSSGRPGRRPAASPDAAHQLARAANPAGSSPIGRMQPETAACTRSCPPDCPGC